MSCSFVQSKSGVSISGDTVGATFTSAITAGNGLLAAVTYIDPNSNGNPYPSIAVADSFGAWPEVKSNGVPLGGDLVTKIFFIPYCKAGPNGAVNATASVPGLMFITIHEVAPNAGEIFTFDSSGIAWGIGWDNIFSTGGSNHIQAIPGSLFSGDGYVMLVFVQRSSAGINPTASGMTGREYQQNTTAVGSLAILGSQATLDEVGTLSAGAGVFADPVWSSPSSIVDAIIISIASTPAIADPPVSGYAPTNEFPVAQTVTLTQDQGLEIRYTTNGSTPTSGSTLYTSPISIGAGTTTLKAIAVQPASGWPPGFWTDSSVATWVFDIFTGTITNPSNIIDGDDTTFAELTCAGATADTVAVKVDGLMGTLGATGHLNFDFEVTQNDLVAPSQTLAAWNVIADIGGTLTVVATGAVGAGVVARAVVSHSLAPGVDASTIVGRVQAICQIPGSSGGVKVRVYAIDLTI